VKFRQLRIAGFKSFVDPIDLKIEPGLTGVVGPNGCGKSNLFESVRWAMGATSAKALRGSGMEDVIFAGTGLRPARNHAEVTLVIENDQGRAPPPFDTESELEVSRRITRGAGSAYRINGKDMRAKDVQLLFADASTGANSPALVRQGQVSELVSAKPQNRRRVLEEAAGIAGLHARRHEAELKLRAAETNLDRLDEEIARLEGELGRLKRQSRQASRYRRLGGDIRRLEAFIALLQWRKAEAALEAAEAQAAETTEALNQASERAASAGAASTAAETALPDIRAKEAEAAAALRHAESLAQGLERDRAAAIEALKRLDQRREEALTAQARERDIADDAESAIARLREEADSLSEASEGQADALETARSESEAAARTRDEAETRLTDLTRAAAEAEAARSAAQSALADLDKRIARLEEERETTRAQIQAFEEDAQNRQLDLFRSELESAQAEAEQARAGLESAEAEAEEAGQAERDAETALSEARNALNQSQSEATGLERALANQGASDWPPALAAVQTRPGYEHALAVALGDDLKGSLVLDAPQAWSGAEDPDQALPEGVEPLSAYVKAPDALAARLSQIGLIDDEPDEGLRGALKPGQRLVTRKGGLWRWDGFTVKPGAPSAAAARLEQRNRLSALLKRIETEEVALQTAQQARDDAVEAADSARQARAERRSGAARAEAALIAARETLDKERGSYDEAERRKAGLEARLAQLNDTLEEAHAQKSGAETRLAQAEANEDDGQALAEAQQATQSARTAASEARAAYDSLRGESQRRQSRLEAIQREIDEWSRRRDLAHERVTRLDDQAEAIANEKQALETKPDALAEEIAGLDARLSEARQAAQTAKAALDEAEASAQTARRELKAAEESHSGQREAAAAARQKLEDARERLTERRDDIRKSLECAPDALAARCEGLDPESLSLEAAESQLEKAKRGRDAIGEVNLRADIEMKEIEERRDQLQTDREDLVAAIAKLRQGVESLNSEGRTRMLEAFEVINVHFQSLFQTLFEGGEAHLELTESDDPLEAGLEIFASPPGKRLAALSLMSGGEQALTATALIFAVFLSNPAPLCILDEVDAPLDDANVTRFCDMLDEMTRRTETRFLIITHNAVTMSRMDRLYGVTMAEQGVSQIVSVDLSRAEQLAAAE